MTSDPSAAGPGALQPAANQNADGNGSGSPPGSAADQASVPDGAPSSNGQSAQAGATADQTDPRNGNVNVAVGNGNGNGNGQAVGQANNAHASATAGATGNDPPPGSDPTAASSASASQTSPTNTNVNVMVGSTGDTGPVDQTNDATAAAAAQGTGGGGQADGSASQTAPANVNVVVRVASPGDNGPVTQANTANASAGSTLPPQGSAESQASTPPFGTNQVVTTSGSAGVDNESEIDQSIEQTPTEDSPATGSHALAAGSAASTTTVGTAAATQTDARNVNVSVRVGSPGTDEHVSQANSATATGTSPTLGVVTVKGGSNTNVSIVLPGTAQGPPAGDWTWNWVWNSSWTPLPGMTSTDVAPTSDDFWNWLWINQQPAAAPAAGASTATSGTSGIWSWTWNWTMAGGQTWTLSWQQPCDCSWTWNWVWDWSTGAPASTPAPAGAAAATDAAPDDPSLFTPVEQENDATATATATASALISSALGQSQTGVDPGLGLQNARGGQTTVNLQGIAAAAQAAQTRASNLNIVYGAPIVSVTQKNDVSADAAVEAMAHLSAAIDQQQAGAPTGEQWAEADQWVGSEQIAEVGALAGQSDARNVNIVWAPRPNRAFVGAVDQENATTAAASAELAAHLEAWIGQYQTAGTSSLQEADAIQVLASEQSALVAAVASQSRVANVNVLLVPAGSRATNPSIHQQNLVSTTTAGDDFSVIDASILQVQDGDVDIELATAVQQASATQTAAVYAPAQQSNLLNKAHWLGVEPPADAAPESEPDTGLGTQSQSAGPSGLLRPTILVFRTRTFIKSGGSHVQAHVTTMIETGPGGPGSAYGIGDAAGEDSAGARSHGSPLVPPGLGFSEPGLGAGPVPGADGALSGTGAPRDEIALDRPSSGSAGPAAPAGPGTPCCGSSTDLGAAGIAPPSGGSSAPGLALPTFKLAAPAPNGPQMHAPTLGRSVAFPEPFERPG
ncbi:MAG TPA: hypothetical protein VGH35_08655 [Gaiellaceae bacterium]